MKRTGKGGRAGGEGLGVEGPDVLDPDLMVNGELEENMTESMSPAIRRFHTTHYILCQTHNLVPGFR